MHTSPKFFSKETRQKISIALMGNKHGVGKWTKERIEKRKALNLTGEKASNWKGDLIGYRGLHRRIRRIFPKPEFCNDCKINPPYDLANISNEYKRDISDWEWLCRQCHMLKDGRIKGLEKRYFKRNHTLNVGIPRTEETKKRISETRKRLFAEGLFKGKRRVYK